MPKFERTNGQHMGETPARAIDSPLIQTRLRVPPLRTRLVQRPHLCTALEDALESKFLLLSAPAGYGKTTLLCTWASQCSWPVAWFSLDPADNDLTRFLTYLVHALQRVQDQVGALTLDLLASRQAHSIERLLTPLVNEFLSVPCMILVLDDYHVIVEPSIHEALRFLLEHLPANLRLIMATRTDPPFPLARLRARHQLRELRAADLRFNLEESSAFLTECMELSLQEEAIRVLDERNEGWITGLQLGALSLQDHVEPSLTVLREIHHFVFDYLAEEVMQQLSIPLQEFLLKTSMLVHLQASLCESVTGQKDGQQQLELLERTNLFLTPLDGTRTWYRYHPLFAGFLQKRLSQNTPELIPELLAHASLWCEQHHYLEEAIEYALTAELYPRAAQLIALQARTLLARRELSTLLRWLEKLPAEIIQVQPHLGIFYCWALLFTFQPERLALPLQQAQDMLDKVPDSEDELPEWRQLRGEIAAIQATLASLAGDLKQTLSWSQQALNLLPVEDLWTRGTLLFFQGVAHYVTGDMRKARQAYLDAQALNQRVGNHSLSLLAFYYLIRLLVTQGRLREALQIHARAMKQIEQRGSSLSLESGLLGVELGNIYYEQNELDRAYTALIGSIETGKAVASAEVLRVGYLALARWHQARGQFAEVWGLLHQLEQLRPPANVLWIDAELQAYRLQWEIVQHTEGMLERDQEVELQPITVLTEIAWLARVRVLIVCACYDVALSLLAKLLAQAEGESRVGSIISITVLQAKAISARGDFTAALKPIQQALILAQPEGYIRVFVDEGESVKAILQRVVVQGVLVPYVMRLLNAFPQATSASTRVQPLPDPLSERELEVLQCIVNGQSNQAIANRLQVSLNTVKTHLSHIFAKLHVNSRTQAAARAKELRLIED